MISIQSEVMNLLDGCDRFLIANATLSHHAWLVLEPAIRTALDNGAAGRLIVGLDLFQADPKALECVRHLQDRYQAFQAYLYELRPNGIFHPKLAIFHHKNDSSVLIGSSNLSHAAWNNNIEADVLLHNDATAELLEEQFQSWIANDRCLPINPESIKRAEQVWSEHAHERKILMPITKHTPSVAGSRLKSAAKENVEHDDLNAWFHEILQSIAPGQVGAYKKGDKRPRIECPGQACQYIFLSVCEVDEALWLTLNLHPGDTVNQARALYSKLDIPAFLALGVHEADEAWQADQWTYHANFHLAYQATNYVGAGENWDWELEDYLEFWQDQQEIIRQIKRGDDDFQSALEPYFEAEMLSPESDQPDIDKHFVQFPKRTEMNVCPGVTLTFWWDLDEAAQLHDQGELIEQVDFRIRQALATWGQDFVPMGG